MKFIYELCGHVVDGKLQSVKFQASDLQSKLCSFTYMKRFKNFEWLLVKVFEWLLVKPVDVNNNGCVASQHYDKREAPLIIFTM